jgi:hypothetical protein
VLRALAHAIEASGASRAAAARWMGIEVSTLARWFALRSSVNVEAVLDSRRLRRSFATCLALLTSRRSRKNHVHV